MKKTHLLNEADQLKKLANVLNEGERNYDVPTSQLLRMTAERYDKLIKDISWTANKLRKDGNNEASNALRKLQKTMKENRVYFEVAAGVLR